VKPLATSFQEQIKKEGDFTVFPNPSKNRLFISSAEKNQEVYYLKIKNALGRVVLMLPKPELRNGLDIAMLLQGVYFLEITVKTSKRPILKKFVKE
jgi:hypothetical protein